MARKRLQSPPVGMILLTESEEVIRLLPERHVLSDRNSDDKYVIIATLQAYEIYLAYYGSDMVIPIYIEVDDKTRIHRAIEREDRQHRPDYVEMCRRFLADEQDFSETSIKNAGVGKRYVNAILSDCVNEILLDIDKIN